MAANRLPRSASPMAGNPRFAAYFASAFTSMVDSSIEKQVWILSGMNIRLS